MRMPLSDESREPDHGRRPLCRADHQLSATVRTRRPWARPTTHRVTWPSRTIPLGSGRRSNSATPSPSTTRLVSPARRQCSVHRRRQHDGRDEHRGHSHHSAAAVLGRVCGTRNRVDPTGMPRSRHRHQRDRVAAGPHPVLAVENAPCAREGRADRAPGRASIGRPDRRDAPSGRALPPLDRVAP
jgi:hypothetical protein